MLYGVHNIILSQGGSLENILKLYEAISSPRVKLT